MPLVHIYIIYYIYIYAYVDHDILSQLILGVQHWSRGHETSENIEPSGHPPLSMAHENSQYAVSVSSHTLQCDPVGHSKSVQAAVEIKLGNENVL